MHAAILGLVDGDVNDPTIDSRLGDGLPAIDAEGTQYLDGATVYHGDCAALVERSTTDVHVSETGITTENANELEEVACKFYADLEAGFVGVDSSNGEWLFSTLGAANGVRIDRAEIDLNAWAEDLREKDHAEAWHVAASDRTDEDNPRVSIDYHGDAHFGKTDGRETSQLGFRYSWNGGPIRGTAAASGYVALYTPLTTESFAKWLREELLQYTTLPDDDQSFLNEIGGDEA